MTKSVKDTVQCLSNLVDISTKIDSFKDQREDVEELIQIMNYGSKIESVLNWLMEYDDEEPSLSTVFHTKTNPSYVEGTVKEVTEAKETEPTVITTEVPLTDNIKTVTPDQLQEIFVGDDFDNAPTVTYETESVVPDPIPLITLNGEPVEVVDEKNPYAAEPGEIIPSEMYDESKEDEESSAPPVYDPSAPNLESYSYLSQDLLNKVINNYDKHTWTKYDKCEWRRNNEYPFMCSETGKFFNLMTNKLEVPYWLSGELFINVNIPSQTALISKRCGIMLATVFAIKRPYAGKTDNWVIDFKNGDRRDLRIDNLTYIQKKDKPTDLTLLLHDICQRCVEHNFDTKKIAKIYEDVKEDINVKFIQELISKKQRTDISDKYWHLENQKPVINTPKLPAGNFLDIAGIFERSRDVVGCIPLFLNKIDGNYDLTAREKELLCNLVKKDLPTGSTYSDMSKNMADNFHWNMTPDEIKGVLFNKTNISTIFNEVIK